MSPARLSRPMLLCALAAVAVSLFLCLLAVAPSTFAASSLQDGSPGQQIFQSKCAACHTVGKGTLVGPDLQGVTQRVDRQWLRSFIHDPDQMFAANDPTALQLLAKYKVRMPDLGLSTADVDAVIAYLQSAGTTSGGGVAPPPSLPAVAGDPVAGQRLFTGQQRLTNGGPACFSCHSVSGAGALGGGALGPNLTHVFQRYNGGTGLTPVLTTIAFPTMVGPFAGHALTPAEVADLVAFFQQQDALQAPVAQFAPGSLTANFWRLLAIGLGGATILTVIMLAFWPRQRQSISARLRSTARMRDA